jgi:hypothetical protein
LFSYQHETDLSLEQIFNLNSAALAASSRELAEDAKRLAEDTKRIAAATRRDSTSMKAIAALTMVFLPFTFVAVSHRYYTRCS